MSEKQIKTWGKIGGFESLAKSWSDPPAGWAFWPLYLKCADYAETIIHGEDCIMFEAACYNADLGTEGHGERITFYDFTFNTGQPQSTLTVRRGTAKKKPEETCCRYLDWRIFK